MKETTIGAHITDDGLEFFGLDEVNALIQQGHKVARMEAGQVIVEEVTADELEEGDEEEMGYAVAGFEITVSLEESA